MTNIYNIFSKEKISKRESISHKGAAKNIAKMNDSFRKQLQLRRDVIPSYGVMKLDTNTIAEISFKLKNNSYRSLDFGILPSNFIPDRKRRTAETFHSGGVVHVGNLTHVIWTLDHQLNKIYLETAEEYFESMKLVRQNQ